MWPNGRREGVLVPNEGEDDGLGEDARGVVAPLWPVVRLCWTNFLMEEARLAPCATASLTSWMSCSRVSESNSVSSISV